jgi:hypothetical protein
LYGYRLALQICAEAVRCRKLDPSWRGAWCVSATKRLMVAWRSTTHRKTRAPSVRFHPLARRPPATYVLPYGRHNWHKVSPSRNFPSSQPSRPAMPICFPLLDDCFVRISSRRVDTPTPYTRDFFYRRDRLVVRTAKRSSPSVLSKHTARMMHAVELVVRRSKYLYGWSNVVGRQVAGAGARPGVSLTVGGVRLPDNLENCYHYATCRPSGRVLS